MPFFTFSFFNCQRLKNSKFLFFEMKEKKDHSFCAILICQIDWFTRFRAACDEQMHRCSNNFNIVYRRYRFTSCHPEHFLFHTHTLTRDRIVFACVCVYSFVKITSSLFAVCLFANSLCQFYLWYIFVVGFVVCSSLLFSSHLFSFFWCCFEHQTN